ncbi:MAG: hypothetical protein ACTSXT_01335 [Candidatus Helarchaeota archaeon]
MKIAEVQDIKIKNKKEAHVFENCIALSWLIGLKMSKFLKLETCFLKLEKQFKGGAY